MTISKSSVVLMSVKFWHSPLLPYNHFHLPTSFILPPHHTPACYFDEHILYLFSASRFLQSLTVSRKYNTTFTLFIKLRLLHTTTAGIPRLIIARNIRPSTSFQSTKLRLYAKPASTFSQTQSSKATISSSNKDLERIMPIDLIHPHISHHDNYFIINNPAIYRTNLLQFLHSCISGSGSGSVSKSTFQSQPALLLKTLSPPSSSDIILITTGPQAPNITLTPSKTIHGLLEEENKQDRRFLRVPRVELRKVTREKERLCERNFGCRCVRCGKRRVGRIAAIKRRRKVRRERDIEEGERSEIEG
jgi:hypothetical protein